MRFQHKARRFKPLAVALSAMVLSGCATFSNDGGLDAVSSLTKERTAQSVQRDKPESAAATQALLAQLLAKPLTPDTAVQIALVNNSGLQASLAELGVAEADLVQAGRMRNPGVSFSKLRGGQDMSGKGIS